MKVLLAYLMLPPAALGIIFVIAPPLLWSIQFTYDWIANDDVIAIVTLERSVRDSMTPMSWFFMGTLFGFGKSTVLIGMRLWDGRWPHQPR